MPNIYLTGMMGSGKSVTGKSLASILGCSFIDLDIVIQEKTQKSIPDIFKERGEDYFREQESKALAESSKQKGVVIATGGGIVLSEENIKKMNDTGTIIFLETSENVLWERVKGKQERPLLNEADPEQALKKIYKERKSFYKNSCQLTVNTDNKTADQVAKEIYELIRNQK